MKKVMKSGYAYVPSGFTLIDKDSVSCQGFFMMKEEVSNFSYREYLFDLKKNNRSEDYKQALPDTTKWNTSSFALSKYVQYYFSHPAYRQYPVVNVSKQQAEKYCEWLTRVWRKNTGNESIVFRLPTRAEFLRAANGSSIDRPYSWNSPYIRREDGKFQCNFLSIGAGAISRDSTGKLVVKDFPMDYLAQGADFADLTAPVRSFWPNEYGIYNLNGNVAEMISDGNLAVGGDWYSPGFDIRNQSTKKFTEANPTVGFRPVMTFVELKSEN
jgi:formylglycine-generating enzyme required for sulfatase activity